MYLFTVDHAPQVSCLIDTGVTDTLSASKGFTDLRLVLSTNDCETKDRFHNGYKPARAHPNASHWYSVRILEWLVISDWRMWRGEHYNLLYLKNIGRDYNVIINVKINKIIMFVIGYLLNEYYYLLRTAIWLGNKKWKRLCLNFLQSYNAYRKDKRKVSFLRCNVMKRKADLPSYEVPFRPSLLDISSFLNSD